MLHIQKSRKKDVRLCYGIGVAACKHVPHGLFYILIAWKCCSALFLTCLLLFLTPITMFKFFSCSVLVLLYWFLLPPYQCPDGNQPFLWVYWNRTGHTGSSSHRYATNINRKSSIYVHLLKLRRETYAVFTTILWI